MDRGLDHALALRPPRRADRDRDAVVLAPARPPRLATGRSRARRPSLIRSVRQHLAVPPSRRSTPSSAPTRCGEVLALGEHRAEPARVRQRPDQHDTPARPTASSGSSSQSELDLLARLVLDLDRRACPPRCADHAHRPQLEPAQLPRQRRVRPLEPEPGATRAAAPSRPGADRPEPLSDVATERLQRIRPADAPPDRARPATRPAPSSGHGRCAARSR